jgi:hypothetical protein
MSTLQHRASPGNAVVPFGKYKGRTLEEVFYGHAHPEREFGEDANPGYLDWLGSQTWLYGAFRKAVHDFLEVPQVEQHLTLKFLDEDPARGIRSTTYDVFLPSEQTARHFSHGRPTWLRVIWGPDRKVNPEAWRSVTNSRPNTDVHQWRDAGPQDEPASYRIARLTSRDQHQLTANGLTEDELQQAAEPDSSPLTPMQAWELASDILRVCEDHDCHNPDCPNLGERCPDASHRWSASYIEQEVLPRLDNWHKRHQLRYCLSRQAYQTIQDAFRLMRVLHHLPEGQP